MVALPLSWFVPAGDGGGPPRRGARPGVGHRVFQEGSGPGRRRRAPRRLRRRPRLRRAGGGDRAMLRHTIETVETILENVTFLGLLVRGTMPATSQH